MAEGQGFWDGTTWRTASVLKVWGGSIAIEPFPAGWITLKGAWAHDGTTWRKFYTACSTGALSACDVYHTQVGFCNGSTCTSYIQFIIRWDHGGNCDDNCHHIEVWSKTAASSACSAVSYTKEVDNLSCDNDPADCTPSAPYDGCWKDTSLQDAEDAAGSNAYYCYEVRIVRDSDEGTDDSCEDYDMHQTIYCPIECGGNGNGP
jgi:hypothetical protein